MGVEPVVRSLSLESTIVSNWRRNGHCASLNAMQNVHDAAWCNVRLERHATNPIPKGDVALLMEYAPSRDVRERCRKYVIQTGRA